VFRLVVGERLDVASVRGDDDQSSAIAVVEQLQQLLAATGLLLGRRGIDGNAVQACPEPLLLGAVEPTRPSRPMRTVSVETSAPASVSV
jgi:hypothetical protein